MKIIINDDSVDPLIWWKNNSYSFPYLSKLARKYLSIMASSVSVERLFSQTGNLVTPKRSNLSSNMINGLIMKRNDI